MLFSGAGIIRPLPLLKPVLVIISMIYIMRGVFGIPIVIYVDHPYLNELARKNDIYGLQLNSFVISWPPVYNRFNSNLAKQCDHENKANLKIRMKQGTLKIENLVGFDTWNMYPFLLNRQKKYCTPFQQVVLIMLNLSQLPSAPFLSL